MQIIDMPLDKLIPYARNPRKNNHAIDKMASAILEFGFRVPVLAKSNGEVIDGHLRIKAAQKLALATVPVVVCDDLSEAKIKALRLNINRMAELADWDEDLLKLEIEELKEMDFDIDLLGFEDLEDLLDVSISGDSGDSDDKNIYTSKVESPIYTPKGPKPAITDLFDTSRASSLIKQIEASELPDDEKLFLTYAAYRHVVFNYQNIAEYYAHSDKQTQNVMENSALVIIDYDKAIELGFVKLTKEIAEEFTNACQP